MVSEQEKVQCVLWYHETKSPITVQRNFRRKYGRPPPDYKSIVAWNAKFKETGSVASRPRTGRPTVSEETVQAVQKAFVRSPSKSIRHLSRELGIPRSTVQKILHKLLHLVQTEMEKHEIVPDVIDKAPSKPVEVMYGDLKVDFGNELTPTQVQNKPTSITWDAESASFYTLLMTDPDAPSRENPKFREWHHWLVGNIPGTDVNKGETLSAYVGSGPPKGTGLHRYVYLVYKQSGNLTFDEERLTNTSGKNRGKFSARKFASKYGLDLIAGNFYQAQYDEYCEKLYAQLKD